MDLATLLQMLDATLRLATPLLLACLAGLYSERAGIFDIGLEGKMLAAAFLSAAVAYVTGNVWLGLLAGIGASMALSLIHGLASITFRGNQLISGVAINFLAAGLTVVVAQSWFKQGGRTPQLAGSARFEPITLPFAETLRDVPVLGTIYYELISGHTILVYVALLLVPITWWVLYRTRFGLRLRAVGENPAAVDTAGVSVVGLRFAAVAICGVLCGIAGAYLATALQAGFTKDMSAGRGYIALAALIFAKWRPWYALYSCLLFGFMQAFALRPDALNMMFFAYLGLLVAALQIVSLYRKDQKNTNYSVLLAIWGSVFFGTGVLNQIVLTSDNDLGKITLNAQLLDVLPFILTVIILAGFVGKATGPKAGGQAYVKER